MGSSFSNSMRSLANDRFSPSFLGLIIAVLILAVWTAWLVMARISVYETSDSARLEVNTSVYPIAAPVGGKVTSTFVTLNREVRAGDVLVEFESEDEKLRLGEARTEAASLAPQLGALRDEVVAEEATLKEQLESARIAVDQARKQLEEAEASVQLAEDEASRIARLNASCILSDVDLARAKTEVRKRRAAAESFRLQVERLQADLRNRESDSRIRIERIHRQIATVEGQVTNALAVSNRLAYSIERRVLRAPISGRIGEAIDFRPGAFVSAGEKLGVIIPPGELKAIAYFLPSSSLGRIQPGQPAQLRLEGFPWTQYGVIKATVLTVASEPRDGHIRIELALDADPASTIPIQHGLPAMVEVEVDRLSPATLLLRSAGERIRSREATRPTPGNRGAQSEQ
jgi:multidrug resistance efflux pump